MDGGTCYLCQNLVEYDQGHLDHVFPISLGGADIESNVAIVHSTCNRKKSATHPQNLLEKFPNMRVPERIQL